MEELKLSAQTVPIAPLKDALRVRPNTIKTAENANQAATQASGQPLAAASAASVIEAKRAEEKSDKEGALKSKLQQAEQLANDALGPDNARLSILYDEPTGRFVYRSVDVETGEVLSEYPPEDVLRRISQRLEQRESQEPAPKGLAIDKGF